MLRHTRHFVSHENSYDYSNNTSSTKQKWTQTYLVNSTNFQNNAGNKGNPAYSVGRYVNRLKSETQSTRIYYVNSIQV